MSKVDGSKYFYWKGIYLRTGSLRAFDFMTKHYAAGNFADYSATRPFNPSIFDRFVRMGGDIYDPYLIPTQGSMEDFYPFIMPPEGITLREMVKHDHIHDYMGRCAKNRFGPRCK